MKSIIAAILAALLAFSLVACSYGSQPTITESEASASVTPAADTRAEETTLTPSETEISVTTAPTEAEPSEASECPTETEPATEATAPAESEPPATEEKPDEKTYVLNTNTRKFHHTGCSSVDDMKESNKQFYTGTRDDVIGMGYSPCGRCKP